MKRKISEESIAVGTNSKCLEKILLLLLIAVPFFAGAQSRDSLRAPKWAIYQVNPLGLLSKERIKVEIRVDSTHSFSLAYTKFFGLSTDNQLFGEYRRYHRGKGKTEFFLYGKAGIGVGTTHGFETGDTYGPYQYALAGGGVGWHVNMGKRERIFFDLSMGLKYAAVYSISGNSTSGDPETTFQMFGSGSVLDISSCFGWQFR